MSHNPPQDVQKYGQSIWIDNIRRKLLNDGTYQTLIDEYGVVGVTSNPTIFQKAIGGSDDYDATIAANIDLDPLAIFEVLAIEDIQTAADLFRPVYERTNKRDGYVSLEVSPLLAHKTAETVAEAKRLFAEVGRPNVMIKIPATPAGIPAIEEAIASGVNVNVTLIFSVENYVQVAQAYIRGLKRLHASGGDVSGVASVASFFLSRIDTSVDQILNNNILASQGRDLPRVTANSQLLGKAAIANAKHAYKRYQEIFGGEQFATLRSAGAMVQRPLWASTGTKNPAYPDTMYVDGLIGADTVNTVPPETLDAFKDHGTAAETLTAGVDEAMQVLAQLAEVGVDIAQITQRLQDDGVEAFVGSFESLMGQIEAKRTILSTGIITRQKNALGIYGDAIHNTLKKLDADYTNARVWSKEASLWKNHGPTMVKIVNRLGWLDSLDKVDTARLKRLQEAVHNNPDVQHVVLLGMGGSSLAPEVLSVTFGAQPGFPNLLVLDSTVPERVLEIERAVELSKTLFIVASKSGSTIETDCFYRYFYGKTGENGGQFIAITDEGSDLSKTAEAQKWRDVFINPSDIGGRYSALSYFGLVPAALLGLDLDRLMTSARDMIRACSSEIASEQNPGASMGAIMGALAQNGRDKLCLFTSPSIESFGNWVEQLVAESTGKEGIGVLPVVGATVGKPHDYSTDRVFVYLKVDDDPGNAELDESIKSLREAGHPRITLQLKDTYALGGEFFRWEYATAIAGKVLKINPFDELNVTESKENTARLIEHYLQHGAFPATAPTLAHDNVQLYAGAHTLNGIEELIKAHGFNAGDMAQILASQIVGTHAGDYFALLAYLPQTAEVYNRLDEIRRRLRHVSKRAVTVGFGPRYLHSTGQLHKGGANNGVFIQLTHDDAEDADIPGKPYSFATLKTAQAAGDLEALETHKRRAFRLHAADAISGLDMLLAAIQIADDRRG